MFKSLEFTGQRVRLQLGPGSRLVDQIDRLIGQEPIGDVTVGELDGFTDRFLGDFHAVMLFISVPQALNDADCFVNARRLYVNGLKAAF